MILYLQFTRAQPPNLLPRDVVGVASLHPPPRVVRAIFRLVNAVIGIHYSHALSALAFLAAGVLLLMYAQGRAREAVTA
jgi:hypothetical protein